MSIDDLTGSLNKTIMASGLTTDVAYTPQGESEVEIKGIFSNAYVEVNGVQSLAPTLVIKLDDLSVEPQIDDTLTINSTDYFVIEVQPDGYGTTTLILQVD